MNNDVRLRLIELNNHFYQKHADSFSSTRQHPWPGWQRLLSHINQLPPPVTVLDVGCGNGRFYSFLHDQSIPFTHYLGVDSNIHLLHEAERKEKEATWVYHDIAKDFPSQLINKDSFSLIVLFGVMHHIPGQLQRLELLHSLVEVLKPGGILVVSFWQFMNDISFQGKLIPWSNLSIEKSMIEPGDYLLDWQRSSTPRYCHHFDNDEINNLINTANITHVTSYIADGKDGNLNQYVVWRK